MAEQPNGQELVKVNGAVVQQQSPQELETQQRYLPVMTLAVAKQRRQMIVEAIQELMVEAKEETNFEGDYGVIPGTKQKTLLQPGADKLNNLFGLVPRFEISKETLDWTGDDHDGEPFFFYEVRCTLWRDGAYLMGEGMGSCNSWESKYRYRKAERVCPQCGVAAIMKSKHEPGWFCWGKKDGCGAKFSLDDPQITEQVTGTVANENIHDLVNTILKIACKRAKIAGTINATSAHEFFTQDIGDDLKVGQHKGETFEQLRARKIAAAEAELARLKGQGNGQPNGQGQRNPASGQRDPQALDPQTEARIQALWTRMKSVSTMVEVLTELKDQAQLKLGDEAGLALYKAVLKDHGVERAEEFRKFGAARMCAKELYLRTQAAEPPKKQEPAPPTIEGEFTATDDDIPAELFGTAVS